MSRATHRTGLLGFALAALAVMFLMAPPDASAQAVSASLSIAAGPSGWAHPMGRLAACRNHRPGQPGSTAPSTRA